MLLVATAVSFMVLDTLPHGERLFESPVSVRSHPDGRIFVTDDAAHRIRVFDESGRLLRTLGHHGPGPGELMWPDAVHWGPDGLFYVADAGANRIQVWSEDGRHLRDIGRPSRWRRWAGVLSGIVALTLLLAILVVALWPLAVPRAVVVMLTAGLVAGTVGWMASTFVLFGGLRNPRDVAVGPDGRIYVTDFNGDAARIFSPAGELVKTLRGRDQDDRLRQPLGLAIASDGRVFVSDSGNHRVQVFDHDGHVIATLGRRGPSDGELSSPHGVAIGGGLVYVADRGNRRVQVWTLEGVSLPAMKVEGGPETFTPAGLSLTEDGTLLIADLEGRRIIARRVRVP